MPNYLLQEDNLTMPSISTIFKINIIILLHNELTSNILKYLIIYSTMKYLYVYICILKLHFNVLVIRRYDLNYLNHESLIYIQYQLFQYSYIIHNYSISFTIKKVNYIKTLKRLYF